MLLVCAWMDAALSLQIARRREAVLAVKAILVDELHVQMPIEAIELDAALFGTGLGLDSVDGIELVMCAETKFGVSLPEDVLRGSLRSINTLVDLVFELQAKQAAT